jgi:hypothetical protein
MGYLNLVGAFVYRQPLFRAKLAALANNDAQLNTDGWAQNTKTLFFQAAVPTGWTQDASQNDKAIRIVGSIGGGGSGGVTALSSTIVLNHTHSMTTPDDGSHTHSYSSHTHSMVNGQFAEQLSANPAICYDNGGYLFLAGENQASETLTKLTGIMASPGSLTLSTQGTHNHGALSSALTDFVFAYVDVIVGTRNAITGTYTDLTSQWHTGDKIDFDPFVTMANNDAYNYGRLMPSGNIMVFAQPTAPTGWTKVGSTNDRMLRMVSGAGGGTGGTQLISSGVTITHSHTVSAVAAHTHTVPAHTHSLQTDGTTTHGQHASPAEFGFVQASGGTLYPCTQSGGLLGTGVGHTCYKTSTNNDGGGSTSSSDAHNHTLPDSLTTFIFAYVDVITCSKDSSGSTSIYLDLTASVAWKKLVSYQRLNKFSANDEYIHYHTTPIGTQAFFFMAAPPTGWTKNTSQNDRALRMVSGSTGGNLGGGSQGVAQTISLAHTHSIGTDPDHSHTYDHTHVLASGTQTSVVMDTAHPILYFNRLVFDTIAGGSGQNTVGTTSQTNGEEPASAGSHNHGGVTNSQLTDVSLAYVDVIWCEKA